MIDSDKLKNHNQILKDEMVELTGKIKVLENELEKQKYTAESRKKDRQFIKKIKSLAKPTKEQRKTWRTSNPKRWSLIHRGLNQWRRNP